ncbi:gag-protease polyprotein, partial [Trifolium medium]|nr:gag-protease polyprotein [Trifolium medium]
IALISKKFNKSLNKLQARWRTNIPDKMSNIKSQSKIKDEDSSDQYKGIRCFECEGFGHIRPECPNYLKKQKKGMTSTLSDSEEDDGGETTNNAFTGKCETSSNPSNEDLFDEELAEAHKHLTIKFERSQQAIEQQDKIIEKLTQEKEELASTIANLKEEVTWLNSKLTEVTKNVRMLELGECPET